MPKNRFPQSPPEDDQSSYNAENSKPTPNHGAPEKSKRKSKLTGYKDRKEIARRMRLEPADNFAIRERREFIKVQCVRRGQVLDKPFEDFDTVVMYKLVKVVTEEMRSQYGSWWPSDLTRDLIHAICLDKVRNNNARERTKKRKVSPTGSAPNVTAKQHTATKRKRPSRTVASSDDESDVDTVSANKKAPGTSKMDSLPPLTIEPVTPTPRASARALESKTPLLLPPFSPLASSPPVAGEKSSGMYSLIRYVS